LPNTSRKAWPAWNGSPYVFPGGRSYKTLACARTLSSRGVTIRILTNSLASNDLLMIHSAYIRYQKALLQAGVELYEFRADGKGRSTYSTPPALAKWIGLHAKSAVFDGSHVYVGSMNLDPRSMRLNTEVGLLVESRGLAAELSSVFMQDLKPENSWRLQLDENGRVFWISGSEKRFTQPAKNALQRIKEWLFPAGLFENQL